jgi:methionyl-tRNA formyltransferase
VAARKPLRAVFMGTPDFALGSLDALAAAPATVEVALVVTRPDAASGRGKALVPSPVKARALELGLPVLETKTLRTPQVQEALAAAAADVFCVAAFGAILPPEVLALPRLGCLNVHASLLPEGRGAAPMQRDLLAGKPCLGFSVMRMEEGLDTGPWCAQGTVEVGERTYDEVSREVAARGGEKLVEVLDVLAAGGQLTWVEQDEARATHAAKLEKAEVLLSPQLDAAHNMWRVQASGEAAPARCSVAGRTLRVLRAHAASPAELAQLGAEGLVAGAVAVAAKRVLLGCANGTALELLEVKPDGKRAMAARDFAAGIGKGTEPSWEAI